MTNKTCTPSNISYCLTCLSVTQCLKCDISKNRFFNGLSCLECTSNMLLDTNNSLCMTCNFTCPTCNASLKVI